MNSDPATLPALSTSRKQVEDQEAQSSTLPSPRVPVNSANSKRKPELEISGPLLWLLAFLGLFAFGVLLTSHNIADWDLWAKLALGAHVWHFGALPHHDAFAFTPVLPEYVDHEWGAGTIFFALLKAWGPASLMWLKIVLACGTVVVALLIGRRSGCGWAPLFILTVPAAGCVLFGYVPVIRSHAFTFFFFALVLFCLEEIVRTSSYDVCRRRRKETQTQRLDWGRAQKFEQASSLESQAGEEGYAEESSNASRASRRFLQLVRQPWPAWIIIGTMLVWVNVHGGFVAGLGIIAIYTALCLWQEFGGCRSRREEAQISVGFKLDQSLLTSALTISKQALNRGTGKTEILLVLAFACLAVTCINPYGVEFWYYLLPAVLAKRPMIGEWQPLPFFASDLFVIFRLLFLVVLSCVVLSWSKVARKSWTGLVVLAVTALLAWRSRRHVPFFGIACLAFAGPYLAATLARFSNRRSAEFHSAVPPTSSRPILHISQEICPSLASAESNSVAPLRYSWPLVAVIAAYLFLAAYAAVVWLPLASVEVLAPVGDVPVREADILMRAQAEGNLVAPFNWGSYAAWRLFPKIKISIDGRYEAAFPESTFQLNTAFYEKRGPHWDRLIRQYVVDYIVLDLAHDQLRPSDLSPYGYVLIWENRGVSALLALEKHAPKLIEIARNLPAATINPLDAKVPENWW